MKPPLLLRPKRTETGGLNKIHPCPRAHRFSRGCVSFLLSPPPSSLYSLCPRNKSAPAVVPKQQMRTRGCLAYSLKRSEASTTFSCPGNLACRELPSRLLKVFPRSPSFLFAAALLAKARRGFFLYQGGVGLGDEGGKECTPVHPGSRSSRISEPLKESTHQQGLGAAMRIQGCAWPLCKLLKLP